MHMELKVRHKAGQSGVSHQTWEWTLWHTPPLSAFRAAGASVNPPGETQPTPGDPVEEPDIGDSSGPSPTPWPHICDAGSALKTLAFGSTAGVEVLGPTQSAWKWL